ncbi:META domain-containing protein [Gulosibacter chungangensis]|uniref:META domain-containing protein n=1 Tax=Gulosibacter chungangensis TaxID=979746 RepID=A0A7J5B7E7_9MICO|nr:META domain-containing protein [Gulosibacter chungangensis]KAB1640556.1 META domain-containing protein [Gulosibacter chungangensis]
MNNDFFRVAENSSASRAGPVGDEAQPGTLAPRVRSRRRAGVGVWLGVVAAASLTFALAGCATTSGGDAGSPAGTWVNGDAQLDLAEDGALSGTDGCNQLSGQWTQDGDTIDFGDVASTMMACEDVDTWLNGLQSATQEGDVLRILDASGAEIGTLSRN